MMTDRESTLYRKLQKAADALVCSAVLTLVKGKRWPKDCTVLSRRVDRVAELLNQIEIEQARIK